MNLCQKLQRPPWRTIIPGLGLLLALGLGYLLWKPGLDLRDGSHDRGRNAIWLGHGWMGGNDWFIRNSKTNQLMRFRAADRIQELADKLRRHHITDVFPHLCPAGLDGSLPSTDREQVERFLDGFDGFRVIPWIGGPNGGSVLLRQPHWRAAFATNVQSLFAAHPRFAGIQINVEPLTSGDTNFLPTSGRTPRGPAQREAAVGRSVSTTDPVAPPRRRSLGGNIFP